MGKKWKNTTNYPLLVLPKDFGWDTDIFHFISYVCILICIRKI